MILKIFLLFETKNNNVVLRIECNSILVLKMVETPQPNYFLTEMDTRLYLALKKTYVLFIKLINNRPWWLSGLSRHVSSSSKDRRLGPRFIFIEYRPWISTSLKGTITFGAKTS